MTPVRAEDDPLTALLLPFLVERTAALGEAAQGTPDPERTLAEVPDWGWLLGVLASSLGFGLGSGRRERDGLALLARALNGALAAEGLGLGRPLEAWPRLATGADDGWSATWAVGRTLLWSARGEHGQAGGQPELAVRFERRVERRVEQAAERLVLHARAGDRAELPDLAGALARCAPDAVLTLVGEHLELSLPGAWFAEVEPC